MNNIAPEGNIMNTGYIFKHNRDNSAVLGLLSLSQLYPNSFTDYCFTSFMLLDFQSSKGSRLQIPLSEHLSKAYSCTWNFFMMNICPGHFPQLHRDATQDPDVSIDYTKSN